jgi:outer membrane immunogenic protein
MKSILTFAAFALSGASALAADLPPRGEPSAPLAPSARSAIPDPWGGFYFGGAASWDRNVGRFNTGGIGYALPDGLTAPTNTTTNAPAADSIVSYAPGARVKSGDQLGGALYFGYNMQSDGFVAGVEADLHSSYDQMRRNYGGLLNIDASYVNDNDAFTGDTGYARGGVTLNRTSRVLWDGSLRARLGAAVSNDLLLFVTGGLAIAQVRHGLALGGSNVFFYDFDAEQGTQTARGSATKDRIALGWTLGAGFDLRLTQSWIMRAEYRFSDYGETRMEVAGVATCAAAPTRTCNGIGDSAVSAKATFRDTSHSARVGVAYLFNSAPPPRAVLARY